MSEKKRMNVVFSGRVQGVGFRATVRQLAEDFVVTGWVKNLPDGSVELEAQGTEVELEHFLEKIKVVMRGNIRQIQRNLVGVKDGEFGFSIEY